MSVSQGVLPKLKALNYYACNVCLRGIGTFLTNNLKSQLFDGHKNSVKAVQTMLIDETREVRTIKVKMHEDGSPQIHGVIFLDGNGNKIGGFETDNNGEWQVQ